MLMLMEHVPIVVSPCCISLWQVSWRRLVFLEPQSIFNRVAPLPDGPAIYGPERGQAGNDWMHRVGETAAMTGWWMSVEQDEGVHYGEVKRDERDMEVVEDRRAQGQPVFITSLLVFHWPAVTEWGVLWDVLTAGWLEFNLRLLSANISVVTGIHIFYLCKSANTTLWKYSTMSKSPVFKTLFK